MTKGGETETVTVEEGVERTDPCIQVGRLKGIGAETATVEVLGRTD